MGDEVENGVEEGCELEGETRRGDGRRCGEWSGYVNRRRKRKNL
jgi:hypothetical protein